VRVGGWLVVEDIDFGATNGRGRGALLFPGGSRQNYRRSSSNAGAVLSTGYKRFLGASLPTALVDAGLQEVGAEIHAPSSWAARRAIACA